MMLMTVPCFGTITALANPGKDNEDNIEWITIFFQPEATPDLDGIINQAPYTDLSIYMVQIGHIIGNSWRVKYWLSVTKQFTGTFKDRMWVDTTIIRDNTHSSETMEVGINGPYYSQWFPVTYKGYHDITVYTDYIPGDPDGWILESSESNNGYIGSFYFWWI
jgi:hypothetical protein